MFWLVLSNTLNFNPRSREGSDFIGKVPKHLIIYFNPRSREGSDLIFITYTAKAKISIHAPAKGATVCETKLS